MGKWTRKRSKEELDIIDEVTKYLLANYDKYFTKPYAELDKYYRDSLDYRSVPHSGSFKKEDEAVQLWKPRVKALSISDTTAMPVQIHGTSLVFVTTLMMIL